MLLEQSTVGFDFSFIPCSKKYIFKTVAKHTRDINCIPVACTFNGSVTRTLHTERLILTSERPPCKSWGPVISM